MITGETIASGAPSTCPDCGVHLFNQVLYSEAAGFYIGTSCQCGPYSRESGYFQTWDDANLALTTGGYGR
jgi:hypothetical protein